ncbi:MAG: leucyl aminopeptidase family protein [Nocardioidaceae bacterium]|nr:leucyl aminopeptidase family protein [Nocardioidaceae bacterium]MCL2613160.1 leucyl aminopeptidase family protein [Nocardioidaceae bacterium]
MTAPTLPAQVSPPEFALSADHLGVLAGVRGVDVAAVPVLPAGDGEILLGPGAAELGEALGLDLLAAAEAHRLTGAVGETTEIPALAAADAYADLRVVVLVGVGAARPTDLRRAGAALARACRDRAAVVTSVPDVAADDAAGDAAGDVDAAVGAFVVGMTLGSFGFHWRSSGPERRPVERVVIATQGGPADRALLERAVALGGAGWRSRMLATVPSNLKNPAWLAEQAERIAADADLDVRVWDERALVEQGFGGIAAVGRASATPPRMIRLDYTPHGISARAAKKLPTVVLVGKGITFDSGGLNIKPGASMATMKRDMTGGAVVLATMAALADVDCPVRVVGLVAAAENVISGDALRPGDVISHWGGRTSEVGNTDAEGRLVLADALAYAVAEVAPAAIVDVATLTGAVKVALGQQVGGIFATDDVLASRLTDAGDDAGEPLWRLPLYAGYEDSLASKIADARNDPPGPGSITAALFLRHFVGDVPWAHLDIASVGDVEKDWHEWTAGPSGFGSRLLLTWLGTPEPLAGIGQEA